MNILRVLKSFVFNNKQKHIINDILNANKCKCETNDKKDV